MKRNDFFEHLKIWEKEYQVQNWNYEGVNYWPLIVNILFFEFHNRQLIHRTDAISRSRKSKFKLLLKVLSSLRPLRIKKGEVLFLGNRFQHIDSSSSSPNRWFVLVYKLLDKRCIHHSYVEANKIGKGIGAISSAMKMNSRTQDFIDENWQPEFDKFLKEANFILGIDIPKSKILSYISQVSNLSKRYYSKFKKAKLKAIFIAPYYHVVGYAMMIAARELRIPTIDVQHGGQGELHMGYSAFYYPPKEGYYLLPKYFWCWDKASFCNIRLWTQDQNFHAPKVLGNPWLIYYSKYVSKPIQNDKNKKVILVTLQPQLRMDLVFNTIAKSKDQYEWWLRCHPRDTLNRAVLIKQANDLGISDHVEIERASTAALPELLESCDLHISHFSGSIIEAADMGVYSIIINKIGSDTYADLIDEGLAFEYLGESETEFLELIAEILQKEKINKRVDNNAINRIENFLDEIGLDENC